MGYTIRLHEEDDGGYSVSVAECPGCFAEGDSLAEALGNLARALESWLLAVRAAEESE